MRGLFSFLPFSSTSFSASFTSQHELVPQHDFTSFQFSFQFSFQLFWSVFFSASFTSQHELVTQHDFTSFQFSF
jgi:hypothetical protein